MATTTNYSWTTPDDTALVKDGAAAIRTLGTAIDTTTKNLNPSTTLGDIEYRSSTSNVNTRLAIGTTGQLLSVSGGVPAWATVTTGGMTLLSTTTLSGTSTVVSGIDGTYIDLIVVLNKAVFGTGANEVFIRPNGSSTLYRGSSLRNLNGTLANLAQDDTGIGLYTNYQNTGGNNVNTVRISQYANTTAYKSVQFAGFCETSSGDTIVQGGGALKTNSAITSITVATGSGYTFSSGTLLIYGVK